MGTRYRHMSKEERDLIAVFEAQGCSLRAIGVRIGRNTVVQVLGDRASRLVRIRKIRHTTAAAVHQAITTMLVAYPVDIRHTITYDNGHKNVEHCTAVDNITFNLPAEVSVVRIYDVLGREVFCRTLHITSFQWNFSNKKMTILPTGVYFVQIEVNDLRSAYKIVKLKEKALQDLLWVKTDG